MKNLAVKVKKKSDLFSLRKYGTITSFVSAFRIALMQCEEEVIETLKSDPVVETVEDGDETYETTK